MRPRKVRCNPWFLGELASWGNFAMTGWGVCGFELLCGCEERWNPDCRVGSYWSRARWMVPLGVYIWMCKELVSSIGFWHRQTVTLYQIVYYYSSAASDGNRAGLIMARLGGVAR
ncbi:hypothetical protein BDW02DRAFT_233990 [Decorospora gaudefroyi]|uniref:Uncharacterized protein n=1 Tax=Decorospora gaudefroyi TaxID=184978 RepID=A0A6A5KSR5_9PLEO|nr:hypothetical protein BDW02DRAFT_233990 [Decorospora gaudefroyi]